MFGRGVIASLLGWALEGAGNEVEFYVRPGRAARLGSSIRLDLYDLRRGNPAQQHVQCDWPVRLREGLSEDHGFDLIIVSVTHDRFKETACFLATRAGRASVLILNNCWEDPGAAAAALPQGQLVWGFPAAAGGFQADGALHGAIFPKIGFGATPPSERGLAVRRLFAGAGFAVAEQRNFRDWLWSHFAVSAAVSAEQLRSGLPRLDVYRNREHALEEAILNVCETMPLLEARGVAIEEQPELVRFRQAVPEIVQAFAPLLDKRGFQAAIESHSNVAELHAMLRDVLLEGRRLGVALPRLQHAWDRQVRA
jgi:2-dehydropantoate 2-reductase